MRASLKRMQDLLDRHVPFAVATVVKQTGSVPGKLGTKMIVDASGTSTGTVGGGSMEEKVRQLCVEAIRERRGDVFQFVMAHWEKGGEDAACGGKVHIAVEYVHPSPHLLLAGGGHVARCIADVCDTQGYAYSIVDDRPEYVSRERFPKAEKLFESGAGFFADADLSPFTHVYIIGYSHRKEVEVVEAILSRYDGFVGLIGSSSKKQKLGVELMGKVAAERLARVRSPIGLDIGAETPEEIAVAVIAEIIHARGTKKSRSKSEPEVRKIELADGCHDAHPKEVK
ncbi:MAG TPA: XdhC/CoxI family protein [Thermoplasmata archaeon]|nr:XdhC/CoxI family protein [Thermoplasmata archaeon]